MDGNGTTRHWLDDPPTVGAVLVTHQGAGWLPKVLGSYSSMFHSPNVWQAVDVGSTDGTAELLRSSFGPDRVVTARAGTGFGDAVRLALEAMPRTDWIWLLHDDMTVLPGTLSGLLDIATASDDIAVVGPKIREWPSLRRLLEVGLTITGTGTRETGLETGEPDAGQHDRPRDVLAVNTAGMLVRRDVWDQLGGLDRRLRLHYDDIDFGWRVARAGYRTRTAPAAVVFHAEASRRGTRPRLAKDVPHWEQRRAAIYTLLANAPAHLVVWQAVRLFFGSLLRVLGLLISKDTEAAGDELLAIRSAYLHPFRIVSARRRRVRTARRSHREIRHLLAPPWLPYQHGIDALRHMVTAVVRPEAVESVGRRSTTLDRPPDEADDLDDGPSFLAQRPWLAVVLAMLVLAAVAGRGLFGAGLHGGALPPVPADAGDWWGLLLSGGHDVGVPTAMLPPVFALLLAAAATPFWFAPGVVVSGLLLLAAPLAALTAHRFGRQISPHRAVRMVWAVSYGLSVVAIGAVAQGRLGTVVALVVLPIIANTAWQLAEKPGWQLALRLGIWIAVGAAFAPVVLVLSLGGLLVLLYAEGRWVSRQLFIAAGVPLLLLGPWLLQRALVPWRVWWEAGFPVPGDATVWDVVLGRGGGPGTAPGAFTAVLVVLALLALVPSRTREGVQIAWMVAVLGLVVALVGRVMTFSTQAGPADLTPWVGVPTGLWVGGLATAVLVAVPGMRDWPRAAGSVLLVAALTVPVGLGGWWVWRGVADPLDRGPSSEVPAFLAQRPGDTLVLTGSVADGVDYRVVDGRGPTLGQEAVRASASDARELSAAVQRLLSQATSADVDALSDAGIDAIYAPSADPEVEQRVDAAPLLEPAGSDRPGSRVWTLTAEPTEPEVPTSRWRQGVVVAQLVAWFVAIVMTAPVRRREEPAPLDDDVDEEVPA